MCIEDNKNNNKNNCKLQFVLARRLKSIEEFRQNENIYTRTIIKKIYTCIYPIYVEQQLLLVTCVNF